MTEQLYRSNAYMRDCTARVLAVNERGGIVLDRTVFYAAAGGQPGDKGAMEIEGGGSCPIATTVYDADKTTIVHVPAEGSEPPSPGQTVRAALDWSFRQPLMRMHTTLHLLCALVKFPVTGGQVNPGDSRLDFDITDAGAVDKDKLTADLNALIAADPQLVRTMAVKPPMGTGKVRLVLIGEGGSVDTQPCGGTHVKRTGEIGRVVVTKIEKKGKQNRRIRVSFE
jgi:misacylated tRNA(Ala) deacylase